MDETLRNESPFVRVGTTLYKIVNQPLKCTEFS